MDRGPWTPCTPASRRLESRPHSFELADLWTRGICPFEYAAFLQRLFEQVAECVDGVFVWRDEADCRYTTRDATKLAGRAALDRSPALIRLPLLVVMKLP